MQNSNQIVKIQALISNKNDKNYTLFKIDDKNYAIETKNVLEIMRVTELDYPHKMPSCVLGLIEYNQTPIGVIDLRGVLNKERKVYGLNSKIIIFKTKNKISAFICDEVLDIRKMNSSQINPVPYQKEAVFYAGLYFEDEMGVYILNTDNIIEYIEKNIEKYKQDEEKQYIVNDEKSLEILRKRKNTHKGIEGSLQAPTPLYDMGVSFIINSVKYYINMASVKEFYKVNNSKFIKLPSVPDYIFGLLNIKGEYITVLDMRNFYGNSNSIIKEKSTIIILNSEEFKIGILADEICESMNINFEEIVQNRFQKQEENTPLEFAKNGEIYQVLDIEQLFQDERLKIC